MFNRLKNQCIIAIITVQSLWLIACTADPQKLLSCASQDSVAEIICVEGV